MKISVQLVLMPSSAKRLIASRPFSLIATLTTMFGASVAKWRPSSSIPSTSSETHSAETGPGVILQTCWRISSYEPPTLAYSVGLVVTPSRTPQRAAVLISSMSAVSRKIFIGQAPVGTRRFGEILRPVSSRMTSAMRAGRPSRDGGRQVATALVRRRSASSRRCCRGVDGGPRGAGPGQRDTDQDDDQHDPEERVAGRDQQREAGRG